MQDLFIAVGEGGLGQALLEIASNLGLPGLKANNDIPLDKKLHRKA